MRLKSLSDFLAALFISYRFIRTARKAIKSPVIAHPTSRQPDNRIAPQSARERPGMHLDGVSAYRYREIAAKTVTASMCCYLTGSLSSQKVPAGYRNNFNDESALRTIYTPCGKDDISNRLPLMTNRPSISYSCTISPFAAISISPRRKSDASPFAGSRAVG